MEKNSKEKKQQTDSGNGNHRGTQRAKKGPKGKPCFDCLNCPAYCCCYTSINITKTDVRRIARRFKISAEEVMKKYVQLDDEKSPEMRMKKDRYFGMSCIFLHDAARICLLYNSRPGVCHGYPYGTRCKYYELLQWERDLQTDKDYVVNFKE